MAQKILIVEDEITLRDLYKQILTNEGYLVDTASDGEEGFNAIKKGGYDLILLDIILPKIDGVTVLKKIQKEPPMQKNGPIVVLSNLGAETVIADGLSLGVRSYIIKSNYTPGQIIQEVKRIFDEEAAKKA